MGYLVEANGIKAKAQVKKANRDTIQYAKQHHCLKVDGFILKEI